MAIREANSSDKSHILKFCKNTFSWGDYIKDVWNYWFSEGNLLVIERNTPIGICHAFFSKNQVWLEGIRIHPDFRRKGLASQLIKKAESLAIQKQISISHMLIDAQNKPSILMAQNLHYEIYQTWNFYSLLPEKKSCDEISFESRIKENEFSHYVKSWRWLPLDQKALFSLDSKNCIINSTKKGKKTQAILKDSEHFKKTLIVTLFAGSKNNNVNLLSYLQNFGFEKKYQRLQILTKEMLPEFKNLEYKISFHLMKKLLS
ncbi:MAG: GNAT family N-acetyltransferase [Nitrosopumilus sp.]|nr:GNAT family N-acetyltransferase [Nitrosopumilus sp.]